VDSLGKQETVRYVIVIRERKFTTSTAGCGKTFVTEKRRYSESSCAESSVTNPTAEVRGGFKHPQVADKRGRPAERNKIKTG